MTTDSTGRLDALVSSLLDIEDGPLTVTATLDLTPDGTGRPPILKALRQAGREAGEGLEKRAAEAVEQEAAQIEEAAADATERGVLGLVWVAHAVYEGSAQAADPNPGPFIVAELASPIRNGLHAGTRPHLFEVARAAFLDRPVVLVTSDLHTMEVSRVRYGAETASDGVDWPAHYLARHAQRTGVDARGGGTRADQSGPGHSYVRESRYVENQRHLFSKEAAEALEQFVHPDDLLVVEGVDEARQQLLEQVSEDLRTRAVQLQAPPHGEEERDRFQRLGELAEQTQRELARQRVEEWFGGAQTEWSLSGLEAIHEASVQGRVATVILHEDAVDHFGSAVDTRLYESPVDSGAVEETLRAALRQGARALFTDDVRVLEQQGGMVAVARY